MRSRILSLVAGSFLFLCHPVLSAGPFTVSGAVVDETSGGPLADARITLISVSGDAREARSDSDGRFAFEDVGPGEYVLRVEAKARQPIETLVSLTTETPEPLKIKMTPMRSAEEVKVTGVGSSEEKTTIVNTPALGAEPLTMRGTVIDETTGDPLASARVTLTNAAGDIREAFPDAEGHFLFWSVKPGVYVLRADARARNPIEMPVSVSDTAPEPLKIRMTPPAVAEQESVTGVTPSEEKAVMGPVLAVGVGEVRSDETTAPAKSPVLSPGPFSVSGTVDDATGDPLGGAQIKLINVSGEVREALSDGDGRFAFEDVGTGEYVLRVEAKTRQPVEMPVSLTGQAPEPLKIKMTPLPTVEDVGVKGVPPGEDETAPVKSPVRAAGPPSPEASARGPFTVSGRVVDDATGDPIPGAQVMFLSVSGDIQEGVASADGGFAFKNVKPGEYVLRVEAKTRQPFEIPVSVTSRAPKPLEVKMSLGFAEEISVTGIMPGEETTATANNADSFDFDDDTILNLPSPGTSQDLVNLATNLISPAAAGTGGIEILVDDAPVDRLTIPGLAVDHIRINKNPYSSEFRKPGKARIEVETQDGSRRRFHGGVSTSFANSAFESKNALTFTKPNMDRRFLEASFSGPLGQKAGSFFLGLERETTEKDENINAQTLSGPLNFNVPAENRFTSAIAHFDLRFGLLHKMKIRYDFNQESSENVGIGGFRLPEQAIDSSDGPEHAVQVNLKDIFSTSYVNDARVKIAVKKKREGELPTGPALKVSGAFTGGRNQTYSVNESLRLDAREVGTYVRGAHTVRFGGALRHRSIDETEASDFGGIFEFASLEDFARGVPYVFRVSQGNPELSYSVREAEAFIHDEVKLSNDLRLMAGVRYDWQSAVDDKNNLAPRVAFAYAPGSQKTVLRGGAGLFYDELSTRVTGRSLLYDGARVRTLVITDPSYPNPFLAGSATLLPTSIFRTAPDLVTPYLLQATLAVERHLSLGNQLTFEYGHLRGYNLFRARDVNAPLPGTGVRPDPTLGNVLQVESTGMMRSHDFTVTYRQVGDRVNTSAQYTLGTVKNDVPGAGGGFSFLAPANNYDLGPEWGRADFDRRHRFSVSTTLADLLPYQIDLGTVVTLLSPEPFDITTGNDDNGDGYATDRPVGLTRNTGQGPYYFQIDARVTKAWTTLRPLRRGENRNGHVQLVVDIFNLTNHTNYSSFIGVMTSPFFGRANAAKAGRSVQLALKYVF